MRLVIVVLSTAVIGTLLVGPGMVAPKPAAGPHVVTPRARLQDVVEDVLQGEAGHYGVAVRHLVTGEQAFVNEGDSFEAASLYKLAVLYAAYADRQSGRLSFDEELTVADWAAAYDADAPPVGDTIEVRQALRGMITVSDNTAGVLLIQRLGRTRINGMMQDLGLGQTSVDYDTSTSPRDMLALLDMIARHQAVAASASQEMLDLLLDQRINNRLPRDLPPTVRIAHKTGDLPGLRHDAGIVYAPQGAYIVVVMSEHVPDTDRATDVIARLSRAVYDYFD